MAAGVREATGLRHNAVPDKLGEALVKIAGRTNPPEPFYAGRGAVAG